MLSLNLNTVRYADDFIVIKTSQRIIEQFVKPAVLGFLSERGLKLSPEKTKILKMESGKELNFLGYTFKYREEKKKRDKEREKKRRERKKEKNIHKDCTKIKKKKLLALLSLVYNTIRRSNTIW